MIHNMLICNGRRLCQSAINRVHVLPNFQEFITVYSSLPQNFPGQQLLDSDRTPDNIAAYLDDHPAEYQSWIQHFNSFKTVLGDIHSLGHVFPLTIQSCLINLAVTGEAQFSDVNSLTFALFMSRQCLAEGGPGLLLRRLASDRGNKAMATFFAVYLTGLIRMRTIMPRLLLSEQFFEIAARRGY